MAPLTDNFKKIIGGSIPDEALFVPLFRWLSGSNRNIEHIQAINKSFFYTPKSVLLKQLTYNNTCKHFIKYPKSYKSNDKLLKFYQDICKIYGWTLRELYKNIEVLDLEELKERVALIFAYTKEERRSIGLRKRGIKSGNVKNKVVSGK